MMMMMMMMMMNIAGAGMDRTGKL